MGKGKTAQRAARARMKTIEPPPPPKPKKHKWFTNPAYHQFEGAGVCTLCNKPQELHCFPGECQTARRERLGL